MALPLIALLVFVASVLTYALTANAKLAEIARAGFWTSLLVIVWANLAVHVIRL
jgi:hypothetical protein